MSLCGVVRGTKILVEDLRWVPVEELRPRDRIVGLNTVAKAGRGRWRKWCRSSVKRIERIKASCVDLRFIDGTSICCSIQQSWLCSRSEAAHWLPTAKLSVKHAVAKPVDVWVIQHSRDAGYLAAAFDGEGHFSQRIPIYGVAVCRVGFSQKDNQMLAEVKRLLSEAAFKPDTRQATANGIHILSINTRHEVLRFLGSIRPVRLLPKFDPDRIGAVIMRPIRLFSKEAVGVKTVFRIETTSETYVANGFAAHDATQVPAYIRQRNPQ